MVKYTKTQAIDIVRIFRYRKQPATGINRTYMKVKDIAKFLNKSNSYVH